MATNNESVEQLEVQAKIRANEHDRNTRKLISLLLIGALLVLAFGIIGLAAALSLLGMSTPAWLSAQVPTVVQAVILGAGLAWGFHLGSSASSRGKDEKPKEPAGK